MTWNENLIGDLNLFLNKAFEFYVDLVYKYRKIVGRNDFSNQFRKIIIRHKRIRYNMYVMRQTAFFVVNQRLTTLLPSLIASRWVGPQT